MSKFDANNFSVGLVGPGPAQQYYGTQARGMPFPIGTSENLAVQYFEPETGSTTPASSVNTADVSGFSSAFDCEVISPGNVSQVYLPWISILAPYFVVDIDTPTCQIRNATIAQGPDHGSFKIDNVTQNYQGLFRNYTCNDGVINTETSNQHAKNVSQGGNLGFPDHRVLLTMADVRWDFAHPPYQDAVDWRINKLTAVLCKPNYTIDKYSVSYSQSGENSTMHTVRLPGTSATLPGLNNTSLLAAVTESIHLEFSGQGGEDYVIVAVPGMFQLMSAINGQSRQGAFMDPSLLLKLGSKILNGVSVQLAHQYFMKDERQNVMGSAQFLQERLTVKRLTTGLIATTFGLLICCSMILAFVRPLDAISVEPVSISSSAVILAASRGFRSRIAGLGSARLSVISRLLSNDTFKTSMFQDSKGSFSIKHAPASKDQLDGQSQQYPSSKWWRPIAVRNSFVALIVILPLCLIGLLEGLQRFSMSRNGLLEVKAKEKESLVLATYLPAFVMVCVATLYSSFDFTISVFTPFSVLRGGNAAASSSVMVNLTGKLAPHAFFLSLRHRHVAHCLTLIAGFIASFLTIVVSGLYSVETLSQTQMTAVQQQTVFNFTHVDLSLDDNLAGVTTSLIEYSNLSYPKWTYDSFILPTLAVPSIDSASINHNSLDQETLLLVTLPAVRGSLDCTVIPSSNVSQAAIGAPMVNYTESYYGINIEAVANVTAGLCDSEISNASYASWAITYYNLPNDTSKAYVGLASTTSWIGDGKVEYILGSGGLTQHAGNGETDINQAGCPSFGFGFGTASPTPTNRSGDQGQDTIWSPNSDILSFICSQRLEEVMTKVTFALHDFSISKATPPIPDESTARLLNGTHKNWFQISLNTLILSLRDLGSDYSGKNSLDPFTQALVWGKDGVPLTELYSPDDPGHPRLLAAASKLYSVYMAQAINANMRTSVPPDGQSMPSHTAILSVPSRRLVQNNAPKVALQAMLAAMVICAIAAYLSSDTKRVLPHNPCSIAGTMTLLADSELCNSGKVIPQGGEGYNDRGVRKEDMFDGWLFSMGWWGDGEGKGERKRFGIDVGRAEKDT